MKPTAKQNKRAPIIFAVGDKIPSFFHKEEGVEIEVLAATNQGLSFSHPAKGSTHTRWARMTDAHYQNLLVAAARLGISVRFRPRAVPVKKELNLYLVSDNTQRHGVSDTYDAIVVCAESPKKARSISPYQDGTPCTDWPVPHKLDCKMIGKAARGVRSGLVLASYNAA